VTQQPPFEVCIVGTGAAGGLLAYRLARAGLRVISLEQGEALPEDYFTRQNPPGNARDFGLRPGTRFPINPHEFPFQHELYAKAAERSSSEESQRSFRQYQILRLNGLLNLWNGVSLRLAPADFQTWPLGYADLESHYGQVERLINVCGTREKLPELPDGEFIPPKDLRPADLLVQQAALKVKGFNLLTIPNRKAVETRAEKPNHCVSSGGCLSGCPVDSIYRFSTHLWPEIKDLDNYTLSLHSKALRFLGPDGTGRVQGLEVLDTQTGEIRQVRAKAYILAAGALETPRILLNSAGASCPSGLANRSGLVGRGLLDNPKVLLTTSLWKLWGSRASYDPGYGDHLLLLARAKLRDGATFPCMGQLVHQLPAIPLYLEYLRKFPQRLRPLLAKMLYRSYVTLAFFAPAAPEPGNRLVLSSRQDRYGVPQVDVRYQESEPELAMKEVMLALGRKLLRKASATLIFGEAAQPGLGIHYAGTCRMSASAGAGVVDVNLRTFDHPNLFICDGSVIPALPEKHLTLTIMALAHRLGEHLAMALRQ
jgi:choline dehydrogenase-like flavoprotein